MMLQYVVIGAIVAWALLYSAWALMPAPARRAAAALVAGWARRCGVAPSASERLQDKLGQRAGCSDCSHCSGCARPAPLPPAEDAGPPRP